ncbi:MAG: SDR family oxidoreductase [Plectolyngbya sp. WJT66-NPBG17]|jgi:NAD(P)-dependent dehydrogenase (short-subunit alcohol dehydrogenase family)|nr:SDR family oxidoreductase [Plectolyngbya sp. WJT66-NPBG17]
MSLAEKKVVIIGASSGMGLAIAKTAAEAGAKVTLVGRNSTSLEKATAEVGYNAHAIAANIADETAIAELFEQVGELDHLVTTAANLAYAPIQEFDSAAAQAIITSKILGPFYAVKHAASRLSKDGSITFFSGVAAWKPMPGASMVAAANGALAAFARSLAVELAPIRVNVVSPGVVETPSWNEMPEEERYAFFENLGKQLPTRRVGQPDDLADAVLFLMQNGFTTGTVLHVDGGHRLI